jgi:hypothetical protein
VSNPTKCWHCGLLTETNGGMIWAAVRLTGYVDEYDVTLCSICSQALFATLVRDHRPQRAATPIADIEQQRARMRDA